MAATTDTQHPPARTPARPISSTTHSPPPIGHKTTKASGTQPHRPNKHSAKTVKLQFDSDSDSDSDHGLDVVIKINDEGDGDVGGKGGVVRKKDGLKINRKFARRFEAKERRNDLFRAQAKGLLDDDSDSESEDDKAEALTPRLELDIMKTISMIKTKDKRIYDKQFHAFDDENDDSSESDDDDEENDVGKGKMTPKMTYKDMVREDAMKQMEKEQVEVESEPEEEDHASKSNHSGIAYNAEQRELKAAFKSAAEINDDENDEKDKNDKNDDDSDNSGDDEIVTLKPKSQAEAAKEEDEFKRYVAELGKKKKLGSKVSENMDTLAQAFGQPSKDDGEEFLRQYVLQRKWAKDSDDDEESEKRENDDGHNSESGEELDKAEEFEAKYNFRFEEEDADTLKSFPRNVQGSLRQKKDKRRKQRLAKKEREHEEKRRRLEELKRLKNLKKQELKARLDKAKVAAGTSSTRTALAEDDLDKEFDPKQHDEMMDEMFSEDYYNEEDESFKPDVSDLLDGEEEDEQDLEDDDEELVKQLNEKELTELHELDYEGIAGGHKTRFRYKKVPATSYGLTSAEILSIPDSLLNEFVSRKRFVTYRDEEWYVTNKQRRRFRRRVREVLEPDSAEHKESPGEPEAEALSPAQPEPQEHQQESVDKPEDAHKDVQAPKKRKRKRKRRNQSTATEETQDVQSSSILNQHQHQRQHQSSTHETTASPEKKKRRRKRKRKTKAVEA